MPEEGAAGVAAEESPSSADRLLSPGTEGVLSGCPEWLEDRMCEGDSPAGSAGLDVAIPDPDFGFLDGDTVMSLELQAEIKYLINPYH